MFDDKESGTKKGKIKEIALYLLIYLLSLLALSLFFCSESCPFFALALATITFNIGLSGLVFIFLKFRKETLSKIGWTKEGLGKLILLGVIFFPPFYLSVGVILDFLTSLGLSHMIDIPSMLMPQNMLEILLGVAMVIVVAIAEEVIFRGYLLTRITEITGNAASGVVISATLFAVGHAYEGTAGMLAIGYIGVVFSLLFLWKKSLALVIVLHFLTDFIPIVAIPIIEKLLGRPLLTLVMPLLRL